MRRESRGQGVRIQGPPSKGFLGYVGNLRVKGFGFRGLVFKVEGWR